MIGRKIGKLLFTDVKDLIPGKKPKLMKAKKTSRQSYNVNQLKQMARDPNRSAATRKKARASLDKRMISY